VVFVSDNQSWVDATGHRHQGTAAMQEWRKLKVKNPKAKLVCIDIQPFTTSQAKGDAGVLNIGGFSDRVFDVVASFDKGGDDANHWVRMIEATEL
jgi:60 kDa SS-A/Ro ribonucleoprotein